MSASLSPTLALFIPPDGKLYLKMQLVIAQSLIKPTLPTEAPKRRLGPKQPKRGTPSSDWPTIVSRVIENSEPLRKMARDYYVSYESMQCVIRAARRRESGPFSNG
jgi:hypothetical protein